ncbi:spermidine synthase [Saccharopolyspora subtropica]|uniref:Spermidine synthase n=1 Tax=Saccharopolyspora thermophila TaxID=89367 RepID=A0A917K3G4_9PSEU|nr:hypothetical protein [Saccharopolyspora subtropica]GGI96540.1 spermidine synthase [Saccharopolyspora subtropica]
MSEHLARALSERGELALLRRSDALELRVNGVFVMDTAHTESERLLASATLKAVPGPDLRVLVGGLGLGFTLREVLADDRVREAHVVEIEPDLVDWHRRGLVPATPIHDDRVTVVIADVADALRAEQTYDLVLLDVDNGPGFLVYDSNSALYRRDFLALCRDRLTPRGTAAIWSAAEAPELCAAIAEVFGGCDERTIPVTLGRHETTYHLFLAAR